MTTAETITLVTNIILYSLLGLILIKCLIGLFKGLWKTTCSLVISIIFYILVITLNTTFTELYYGINLSFISSTPILVNNVEVTISTIGDTLREVVMALTEGTLNLTKSDPVFKVCDALAMSILSFFVFILHIIIVTFIISPIISTLVYHLILKNILGSNITKKHKLKLAGFFVGGLKATITMGLLLTPFTALANQIGSVVSNEKYQFEGDADELKSYVDAYSNSSLAKVLTTFKINGNSLDVCLTNAATTFKVDDNNISFLDELAMVTDIACVGMQEGIITLSGVSTEVSAYLSKNFVTSVLIDLADSSLVTTLLPVTLGIICNLDNIKENIDLTSVDWNIDWQDELTALSDVYAEFYDTGLISAILNPEELNSYEFSRDTYQHFKTTFERMNDIEILNDVMPHVLASFARSLEENESALSGIFPTDVEKYKEIEIGKELGCIYDAVMTLSDLSSYAFNDSTEVNINKNKNVASNNETRRYLTIGDLQDSEKMSTLISFLLSENGVKGGDVDDEGNVTVEYKSSTKESYSINTELVFNGNDKIKGLLDSTLISNNIVSLLKYAFNSSEEMKALDLGEVLDDIEKDSSDYVWKEEVSSLLNICSVIMNLDFDNFNIFEDAEELRKITPYINDSKLITKLAPTIVTTFLGEEEIIYGLYATDFEFGCDDLGTEIDNLLSVLPKINDLQNSLSNGINGLIDSDSMAKDIEDILNTIYASKIINPEPESGLSNFEVIVKNVFGDENLIKSGFEELDGDTLMKIRDADGGWKGEIGNICSALENLSKNDTLKKLIDPNKYNEGKDVGINDIDASDVSTLIEDFASSTIIKHSLGSVLNKYLQGQMEEMGVSVNFKAVNDWGKEADNLASVITSIQELDGRGFSLGSEDIKITSLRYYRVNELEDGTTEIVSGADDIGSILESLSKLQSVSEEIIDTNGSITYKNKFGDVVYNITEQMLGSYMECKDSDGKIDQDKTAKLEAEINLDHNFSEGEIKWVNDSGSKEDGKYVIDDIVKLIDHILGTSNKDLSGYDYSVDDNGTIKGGDITSKYVDENQEISFNFLVEQIDAKTDEEYNKLLSEKKEEINNLLSLINNVYIWRTLLSNMIPNIIEDSIDEMNLDGLDVSLLNSYTFKNDLSIGKNKINTRADEINKRKEEIEKICDVYYNLEVFNRNASDDDGNINVSVESLQDEGLRNDLSELLNSMAKSRLFNEIKNVDGVKSDHTFFEDTMKYMLDLSSLDTMMDYKIDDKRNDETKESAAQDKALNAIKSVTNNSVDDEKENYWIGSDGEISKFIKAIECASSVSSIFTKGEIGNEGGEGEKVKNVITSFAKSKVLNYQNSLGNILNSQIRSTLTETGLEIDFTKVGEGKDIDNNGINDEWEKEAENLGILIDNVNGLNDSSSGSEESSNSFNIDIDIKNVNTDKLQNVLDSLSELYVVQRNPKVLNGTEVDNYGYFIYTNVTKTSFSDYITSDDIKDNVISDHNIFGKDLDYNNENNINVSWINNDNDYKGENSNIVALVSSLKEANLFDTDGNVSFEDFKVNDSTRNLIINLNKNYIFRSLIKPILKEEISSLNGEITEIKTSKAYISVFDNEYNYQNTNEKVVMVGNRSEEVKMRNDELGSLVDIFGYMESLNGATGDNKYKDLMGEDKDNDEGTIEKLLKESNKSKVLSMVEPSYNETDKDYSIFEDTVKYILDQTTLTSYIEYEYKEITKENRNVKTIIKEITNSKDFKWEDSDENKKDGEISKLCDVLFDLTHLETKDSTSEVKQYVNFNDSTKINSINTESAKTFMESLNESYLCHGAVGSVVNKIYEETGIMDYALDRNNLINAHYLDYDSENSGLKEFSEQKKSWNDDIDPLFDLYNVIGANGDVNDSIIDFDGENEKVKEGFFASVIPNLMKLQNVKNCHSDILYGLFSELNLDGYIYEYEVEQYSDDDSDKSTIQHYYVMKGEEKYDSNIVSTSGGLVTKYYSITDFARRDTLKILINEKITDWEFEGERLDKVANEVYTNTSSSIKTLDSNMVYNVLSSTYKYDELDVTDNNFEARYKRGYLASELVSSFVAQNSVSFVGESEQETYLSTFWRGKGENGNPSFDYKEINKYEIEALKATKDAITLIGKINEKDYSDWRNEYLEAMGKMGCSCGTYQNAEKTYCFRINGVGYNSPIAKLLWTSMSGEEMNSFKNTYGFSMNLEEDDVFHEKCKEWIDTLDSLKNLVA